MDTVELVNAAVNGDKEAFVSAFNQTIADRVTDALELKKVELATQLLSPEEQTNELETVETEISGSSESNGEEQAAAEPSAEE